VVSAPGELGASGTITENGAKNYDFGTRLLRFSCGKKLLKGNDVLAIQTRLMELGFDTGKVDGAYGPKTAASVVAFQGEKDYCRWRSRIDYPL
jgi:N-acetylmuramoyl-L-alanine amidase